MGLSKAALEKDMYGMAFLFFFFFFLKARCTLLLL